MTGAKPGEAAFVLKAKAGWPRRRAHYLEMIIAAAAGGSLSFQQALRADIQANPALLGDEDEAWEAKL